MQLDKLLKLVLMNFKLQNPPMMQSTLKMLQLLLLMQLKSPKVLQELPQLMLMVMPTSQ